MQKLALILVVAACSKGDPAKTGPDCVEAVDALVKAFEPSDALAAEKSSNLRAVLKNRCTEDTWSDAARSCIVSATTKPAQRDCWYKHLTQEQGDKLRRAAVPAGLTEPENRELVEEAFTAMNRFKTEMCVCKESACAQHVSDEMTKWSQDMAKNQKEPPKMTEEDAKRAAQIGEEMSHCMQAAMAAGSTQ